MSLNEELFQISKLLLAEEGDERTPEVLLRRILEKCGAETGFVVVRENGSFLMRRWGGNVSRAARAAGFHRGSLRKLLARHRKGEGT